MTFSYTAAVPPSAAYDDTTVTSPRPIFRNLADTVDVTYRYAGPAGQLRVHAELSTAAGWSSTVPLGGLLVLTWSRGGIDTYVVQDEGTSYRYRSGTAQTHAAALGQDVLAASVTHGRLPYRNHRSARTGDEG